MLGNFKKEDLRVKRTIRALTEALPKLLKSRSFERITVNDLCDEAEISRSAFYAHFQDKFDLLRSSLVHLRPLFDSIISVTECREILFSDLVSDNSKQIINLIEDASSETRGIIIEFFVQLLEIPYSDSGASRANPDNVMLANLCAGGLLNIVEWQVKNRFPEGYNTLSPRFCQVLSTLLDECRR